MTDGTDWIVPNPEMAARLRISHEYVVLEDHWIPRTIELSANGAVNDGPDPEVYARVEVNDDGVPRLAELRMLSTDPHSQGVRQADLREFQVSSLVEDLLAAWTVRLDRDDEGNLAVGDLPFVGTDAYAQSLRLVGRLRSGRTSRDVTPELLQRVAAVYRKNIDGHPTKAVQYHFQVSQRMAAEYVSRARKRGLLPPTKKGKKNA